MPLSNYKAPTYPWQIGVLPPDPERPDEDPEPDLVYLYGLSLADITTLLNLHRDKFLAFVGTIQDSRAGGLNKLSLDDNRAIGEALLAGAPDIAADLIAMAARQPDQGPAIREMPFPLQLEAFEEISKLTFAASSQKKVLETIIRVLNLGKTLANVVAKDTLQSLSL